MALTASGSWELESLARTGAYFVIFGVALGVGWVLRKISWARTVAHLPSPVERAEQLHSARVLRRQGASLDECIAELRRQGVHKGVARSMVLDMEREQSADVGNPLETNWRGWRMQYPGNWRKTAVLPVLGEDPGIQLEAIGGGMVLLLSLDEEKGELEQLIQRHEAEIETPTRSECTQWGALCGEGVRLRGAHLKLRMLVDLLVFRPSQVDPPFAVVEWHMQEQEALIQPGFDLIQSHFQRER